MNKAKVILIGKINSSQDGVIISTGGGSPCHTSGHGNTPKILEIVYEQQETRDASPK